MSTYKNQSGFSAVEILLAIVVVGLLGFGLFTVYDRQQEQATTNPPAASQNTKADDSASEINSTEDLTAAEKTVDETDVDNANDSAQLESQLSAF